MWHPFTCPTCKPHKCPILINHFSLSKKSLLKTVYPYSNNPHPNLCSCISRTALLTLTLDGEEWLQTCKNYCALWFGSKYLTKDEEKVKGLREMILLMRNRPFEAKRITDSAFPRLGGEKKRWKQDLTDLASYLPFVPTMWLWTCIYSL